jgi:hypothetical protein
MSLGWQLWLLLKQTTIARTGIIITMKTVTSQRARTSPMVAIMGMTMVDIANAMKVIAASRQSSAVMIWS